MSLCVYVCVCSDISFSGLLGVIAAIEGCWRVFGGVGGPLSFPPCFKFRHVNQARLGYTGQALGCEG